MSEQEKVEFKVDRTEHGYNHVRYSGTFTGTATIDDLKKRFYHEYFGGREARINADTKTFSVVKHID